MSLNLIPALKGHGRHRGKAPAQLRRELDEATCHLVAMATEINELRADRNEKATELDKAAIDYANLLEDRDEWRNEALALWERFGPQLADEANTNAVTVPPAYRDTTDPEDQATVPVPIVVRTLQQAHCIGPVTDPGRIR